MIDSLSVFGPGPRRPGIEARWLHPEFLTLGRDLTTIGSGVPGSRARPVPPAEPDLGTTFPVVSEDDSRSVSTIDRVSLADDMKVGNVECGGKSSSLNG